ncbi:YcxB family protein [Pedobacter polaris]|uniref:YcxB family protein n=1 Tax=Pedobacter polaris TaxID=2571273 RepID=A0A4U1CU87_9SPHI|nr:YcxB family protein [Pedobacter polaris]TKC12791.1 YcxB family protein [Pedobacter polaris]
MYSLTLSENDHITFQLYEASTNSEKRKSRKRSFFIFLALGLFVIILGYQKEDSFLMYYGVFCSILVICFGNTYLGWRHKKHYIKHVKNKLKDLPEEIVEIEINDDQIKVIDRVSNTKIKISEITLVNEIKSHYFLKLSTGPSIVIPKSNPALNEEVLAMISNFNLQHIIKLDWKWS